MATPSKRVDFVNVASTPRAVASPSALQRRTAVGAASQQGFDVGSCVCSHLHSSISLFVHHNSLHFETLSSQRSNDGRGTDVQRLPVLEGAGSWGGQRRCVRWHLVGRKWRSRDLLQPRQRKGDCTRSNGKWVASQYCCAAYDFTDVVLLLLVN